MTVELWDAGRAGRVGTDPAPPGGAPKHRLIGRGELSLRGPDVTHVSESAALPRGAGEAGPAALPPTRYSSVDKLALPTVPSASVALLDEAGKPSGSLSVKVWCEDGVVGAVQQHQQQPVARAVAPPPLPAPASKPSLFGRLVGRR